MAKSNMGSDRRAVVERMRQQQKVADRRRSMLFLGACVLAGVLIIGAALFSLLRANEESAGPLVELGTAASDAGCRGVITRSAEGEGNHVATGTEVPYPHSPPAFGPHYDSPQPMMQRKFYTADDRPPLETLVHNLEHGFTLLWYDETIAENDEELAAVRAITKKYPATSGLEDKFLAVPWTSEDGEPFPEGAHVALTHWSNRGADGNPGEATGIWQYCETVSGEVVDKFVEDYPFTDAPEGGVPG